MSQFFRMSMFLLIILPTALIAQKHVEPSTEDVQLAGNLKEIFTDDEVGLIDSEEIISFEIDKDKAQVIVHQQINNNLINLESRSDIQIFSFYDSESEITEFEVFSANQKKARYKIMDEAYKDNDLFHNDVRVKWVYLDFPVKAYRYETRVVKEIKDIKYFTKLNFNDQFPARNKKIVVTIPEWLDLELKEINFQDFNIKKESIQLDNGSKRLTYTLENIPAMSDEDHIPGPSHIYPHLLVLPKSYSFEGTEVNLFKDTQDLYNWYKSLANELENDNTSLVEKVQDLTAEADNEEEKIKNIYYWIQDNIRYIAFEDGIAGFKPDEASHVFNKRYGDCKGMANLTKQMLTEAGFDARLTWIGTNHIAYDYSTPNLSVDNHMICTVMLDDKMLFLDGTEKFNSMGEYASRIQGKQMLIENGEDFILKNVPIENANFNTQKETYHLAITGEEISGTVHKTFAGESRASLLHTFNSLKNDRKDDFLSWYLSNGNNNIQVANIRTSDLNNRDTILNIEYDIRIKNAVSTFGDMMYLDLDMEKELSNLEFEKRKSDYQFYAKKNLESTFKVTIPEGYSISSKPQNFKVGTEDYELSINYSEKDGELLYQKQYTIKDPTIKSSEFKSWNANIQQIKNIYNEQIILSKD
ncbi:transglutaminase-like domain-containing protein [Gramella sp. AN32]|uniref:Transglutaminase family protein n=1 Tax=Christiangramia antarctica TaxID=2058158 RepID=A0ABW5X1X9_9FLAO|nr:transglutaminase-like domain-containing protein [Gramella sp. AN32]MCM4156674.1 hypothetical protein [Gramella sp. AN32]